MSSKPQDRIYQQGKPWLRAARRAAANKTRPAATAPHTMVFVPKHGNGEAQSTSDVYQAPAQVIIDQGDGKTLHIHVAGPAASTQHLLGLNQDRQAADEDRAIEETDQALAQVAANIEVMRRDQQEIDQLRAETRVLLHQLGVA